MRSVSRRLTAALEGPGGLRDVLAIAYPLILGNVSFTLQNFLNRLFLTWYGADAVAGAVTGAFVNWVFLGFFIGTGEYLTTFVAQYLGAGRPRRIGPAMWQGVYFAVLAGLLVLGLRPLLGPVFALAGHAPAVQAYEVSYTRTLAFAALPSVLFATLSSFFAGRGETRTLLLVNIASTGTNALLDYCWIFGHLGFPRAGVVGAALATVVSQSLGAGTLLVLMMQRRHRQAYGTASGWRLDPRLFLRLLRYGLPSGLQFSLEVLSFTLFLMLVGRIGTAELAASGIAFNLNSFVFWPMLGMGIGVASLVGRYLGAERPEVAERATHSAFAMSLCYMSLCGLVYVLLPDLLLRPYAAGADPQSLRAILPIARVLLRFVAVYSIFDMMNLIFAFALRGAGDTLYPLLASVGLSITVMLVPTYLACTYLGYRHGGIYVAWSLASAYVVAQGLVMGRRFQKGAWKSLRIIDREAPQAPRFIDREPEPAN